MSGTRNDFLTWDQLKDHIKIHKIKFYLPAQVAKSENCSNKGFKVFVCQLLFKSESYQ